MNPGDFKAFILDMDGVITRTARTHASAWKAMFDEFLGRREGKTFRPFDSDRDYRLYIDGKPRYDGVQSFLASRGIELPYGGEDDPPDAETVCGLGNRKNELLEEVLKTEGVEAYEDAVEQIGEWKRAGCKVAVISSSRNCEEILRAADMLDAFDARVDGVESARLGLKGKPAPDIFLRAAELLGVESGDAVVVEDAIAGVEAGRNGGFGMVVAVARDGDGKDLAEAGADRVVRDLRELGTGGRRGPVPALEHSEEIVAGIRGKELALFLDYDGTLTPIVRRPEEATLSEEMRSLLAELAGHCTLAIVSGRDRRNVEEMVHLDTVVYAGSHGFDIGGPGGLRMVHEEAQGALGDLDRAEEKLRREVASVRGARVERKKFAVAVHYREVESEEETGRIERVVDEVVAEHGGLRKRGGKKIFELQPDVEWDKGRAVLWLVEALGLDHPGVALIYVGDDVTDEDAFAALRSGARGVGIRVADSPAETQARYHLRDCGEVRALLQLVLDSLRQGASS